MKMKKWLAVSMTALAVTAGSMVVSADSLTLSGGEVLDMGSSVSVYPGERSFFGSQLHDWLMEPNAAVTVEKALEGASVFPKDKDYSKEFSEMAVSILRTGKVYQVRAAANDTYYQGMMVSLSVSDGDMLKLAMYGHTALSEEEKSKAAETAKDNSGKVPAAKAGSSEKVPAAEDSMDEAIVLFRGAVKVENHSAWEDRKSDKGLSYRTGDARLVLNKNGFMIPLYVKGVITRGEGKTVYTVFAADQASGRYFQPLLDKALKEAKK
ncbi:hypothetical protein [Dialister sp.]|mgnify:FL=1|jgi:hypothetical protein|uniref:hypothetical protein n=1 Tax=Dialister sp. TaxID=1955814 RepID=UPI0025E421EF|nr:hypothetical protein [Dialister sp.]MEE0291837.1 hypothetical protein [Dialister sp.]